MFGRCLQFLWWLWRYNVHLTQAKKKAEEEKAEKERIEREAKEKEAAAKAELAANQKANDKVCFYWLFSIFVRLVFLSCFAHIIYIRICLLI